MITNQFLYIKNFHCQCWNFCHKQGGHSKILIKIPRLIELDWRNADPVVSFKKGLRNISCKWVSWISIKISDFLLDTFEHNKIRSLSQNIQIYKVYPQFWITASVTVSEIVHCVGGGLVDHYCDWQGSGPAGSRSDGRHVCEDPPCVWGSRPA